MTMLLDGYKHRKIVGIVFIILCIAVLPLYFSMPENTARYLVGAVSTILGVVGLIILFIDK